MKKILSQQKVGLMPIVHRTLILLGHFPLIIFEHARDE
jgi:hypothetical protein